MKFFECKHPASSLLRVRVHRNSVIGLEHGSAALCADKLDCFVILQCQRCGKYIKVKHDDNVI